MASRATDPARSRAHRRAGVRRADVTAGRFIPAKPLLRTSVAQASAKSPCPGPTRRLIRQGPARIAGPGRGEPTSPRGALSPPSPSSAQARHKPQPNRRARERPGDARRPMGPLFALSTPAAPGRGAASRRHRGALYPRQAAPPLKRRTSVSQIAVPWVGPAMRGGWAAVRAASRGSLGRGAANRRQRGALYPRQAPPPLKRRTSLSQIAVPGAGPAMRGGWAAVRAASCGSLAFIGQVRLGRTKAARSRALQRIAGR